MFDCIPSDIKKELNKYNVSELYEIRIRVNMPISINVGGIYRYIGIIANENHIKQIINIASDYSLYSVEESIKRGFVTTRQGERIGLCGECVYDNGKLINIKNVTSLTIRIPHLKKGIATKLESYGIENKNLLILSPPAFGKTTMLRDIIRELSETYRKNVLVIDERNEITATDKNSRLDVGKSTDVMLYCDKSFGLEVGIRSMRPDVIALDEVYKDEEFSLIEKAEYSGIKVVCTAHADDYESFQKRFPFVKTEIFDRVFTLSSRKLGEISQVVANGEIIYAND